MPSSGESLQSSHGKASAQSAVPPQARKKRRTSLPPDQSGSWTPATQAKSLTEARLNRELQRTPVDGKEQSPPSTPAWQQHQQASSVSPDTQLAEALQHESRHFLPSHVGTIAGNPQHTYKGESPQIGNQSEGQDSTTSSVTAPMLQKQRRRNFSNRTKTGCLTCRERKKKCDETRPKCSNCERGGFFCKGYSQVNGGFKPVTPREQPQLQAKNEYYDPTVSDLNIPSRHRPTSQSFAATPETRSSEGGHSRPVSVDEASDTSRFVQTQLESSRNPNQGRHDWLISPQGSGNIQPQLRLDYPPALQHNQQSGFPHPGPPIPLHPPTHRTSTQLAQYNDQRMTAQLALEQSSARSYQAIPVNMYRQEQDQGSEKEKMMQGLPFRPSDAQLKRDRHECSAVLYRFNRNVSEHGNLSENAKREQFRRILDPKARVLSDNFDSPHAATSPRSNISGRNALGGFAGDLTTPYGRLGTNVDIQAPFHCDYGYNIRIGDDVDIGSNCRIMDSAIVEIGARTTIEPDVKILTADADFEGSFIASDQKRLLQARKVVIEDDCYIGAGAIIMPGVTLPKGTVVRPGAIVPRTLKSQNPTIASSAPPAGFARTPTQWVPPPQF